MKLITVHELFKREHLTLPTLIIDARMEDECRTYEMIDSFTTTRLDSQLYAAKRIMPTELNAYLDKIIGWQSGNPTAIVAVGCTRMVRYCPRIETMVNVLRDNGIDARGIDPHLYEFMNLRFQRKLPKILF